MGFPALTTTGETVTIVDSELEDGSMKETFTDSNGKKYTRDLNGDTHTLIPLEEDKKPTPPAAAAPPQPKK